MEKSSRYVDNGDGTVTDNTTGLMWTKDANHGLMSWLEAVKYCADLDFAGQRDWRLPLVAKHGGIAELDTLFRKNGNHSEAWEGTKGTPFTTIQPNYYWSGTSDAYDPGDAWGVYMVDGDMGDGAAKTCRYDVWPVRGGQKESFIRAWVTRNLLNLHASDALSLENLFILMISGLSDFGGIHFRPKTPTEINGLGVDMNENYSNDAALFELGCYMYFRIDLWLFQHAPERRDTLSPTFAHKFIDLFSKALNSPNIPTIFDQRIAGFGQLVRTGTNVKRCHFHLTQLILRSKDPCHPEGYDFNKAPVMIVGFENMGVEIALATWEQTMLPAIVNGLQTYCQSPE